MHARIESDPAAALADLEEAVKLSPNSIPARQNQAYVLDKLNRNEECLAVLTRLTELAPAVSEYRSGRAVVLARLKKYEEAIRAITKEMAVNPSTMVRYQAACVYAQAGKDNPTHKTEALRLLTAAIRDGFPATDLATDKDFDPIRGEPEFQRLLPAKK